MTDGTGRRASRSLRLPRPPGQREDLVDDFGWLSSGYAKQAREQADRALEPMLLGKDEPSDLPADPPQPPPLPPPPDQQPEHDERGRDPEEQTYRVRPERESGSRRAG